MKPKTYGIWVKHKTRGLASEAWKVVYHMLWLSSHDSLVVLLYMMARCCVID